MMKTTAQLEEEDHRLAKQVDDYNDQFLEMQAEVSDLNAQINHHKCNFDFLNIDLNH
jgi:uncharacterized protein YhaN